MWIECLIYWKIHIFYYLVLFFGFCVFIKHKTMVISSCCVCMSLSLLLFWNKVAALKIKHFLQHSGLNVQFNQNHIVWFFAKRQRCVCPGFFCVMRGMHNTNRTDLTGTKCRIILTNVHKTIWINVFVNAKWVKEHVK